MKRFSFNLETVRRLRDDADSAAQAELAAALGAAHAAAEARALRERTLAVAADALVRPSGPAHLLQAAEHARDAAALRLGAARKDEARAEDDAHIARHQALEARRALEAITRLRARRAEEHRLAVLAEEERVSQEISEARAARAQALRRKGVRA